MGREERRFPRYRVDLPVVLKDRNRTQDLVTGDVSRHGAFLCTDTPKPLRQLIQLTFQLSEGVALEVMGMVARSVGPEEADELGPGMGVDFFAMSKGARDTWEGFVRRLGKTASRTNPAGAPADLPNPPAEVPLAPPADAPSAPPARPDPEPPPQKPTRLDMVFDELPEDDAHLAPEDDDPPPALPPVPATKEYEAETAGKPRPVRRHQPRFVASFMVRLKDRERLRRFHTRDIGSGGMFLKTPLLKAEGDDVQLVLIHPETDQEFRLGGTVVRVDREGVVGKRGMGIRFHPRDAAEESALQQFIESGADFLDPPPDEGQGTITALQTATELAPDSPRAHFSLGKALMAQDKLPEAIEELDRALSIDPDYLPAHRALQEAFARSGDTMRAFTHLKEVKRLEREGWSDGGAG